MKNWILLCFVSTVLFTACDNSLDINAPWRETPVVFAIIDLGQDSQIIRIHKTFQNSSGQQLADVSQLADSLYMRNISVKVISGNNPNVFRELKRLAPRKESGMFANTDSSFWGDHMPNWFAGGVNYKLLIHSFETGKDYLATTDMVGKADITLLNSVDLINPSASLFSFQIKSIGTDNVAMADAFVRLYYEEVDKTSGVLTQKYLDFVVRNQSPKSEYPNKGLNTGISKSTLLSYYRSNIPANSQVTRTFVSFEYGITGYNTNYRDMLLTNAPSGSIIPKYGDYSNIADGIGVFASKTTTTKKQNLNAESVQYLNAVILNR